MNNQEPKTVLVTGGSGYIGGMVCRLLVDAGHNVINIDRKKKEIPGVTQYPFDIDSSQIKGVIQLVKPDTIMHFAADHEVGRSVLEPAVYYWNNVANSIALLNHAVNAGVKNFVFSSSSSVYGDIDSFPTTENTPKAPVSPYGKTKSMVEDMLDDYANAYDINFVALRYFNAAGADPALKHGYVQEPASHIVPIIARKIISGESFEVFGNDYDTADGTCERDYTHVFDIATAHLAAMNYLDDGGANGIFNIGANGSQSVMDVISAFEKVVGTTVPYTIAPRRAGDPPKTWADNSKAKKAFGWEPQYGLEDIVKHAYEWEKKSHKH
jgi:UDP-glucose 4-epimerase